MLELTSFNPHISKKRIQRFLQCNDIISLSHCLQLKPEVLESALTFDELFACVNKDIADILKNKEALKSLIINPV
jgi:hypothetical protein